MDYHYIENEWVNALLSAFSSLGLDIKLITKGIEEIKGNALPANQRLEISALRTMWHRADKLANDALLGVKVGSLLSHRALGVLAPVVWHSPTIRALIENYLKFQILISENGQFRISESQAGESTCIHCEYIAAEASIPVNGQQMMSIMVTVTGMLTSLTTNKIQLVKLSVDSSIDKQSIAGALNIDTEHSRQHYAICFNVKNLDQAIPGVDRRLYQLNLAYAEELLGLKTNAIVLLNAIKDLIKAGGYATTDIEFVARELGLNKRAIQRRLANRGTSFRRLKEEVLKETSVSALLTNSKTVEELATYLGYSEPSAFYRAFKSWYNMAPREFCEIRRY